MKKLLEFAFIAAALIISITVIAKPAAADERCKVGQKLICMPVTCPPGYAKSICLENPPAPNCFCADEPSPAPATYETFDGDLQDGACPYPSGSCLAFALCHHVWPPAGCTQP